MSISVVMPCYNEEEIIVQAVREMYEAVSRETDDFEFLLVDDHSSDKSPQLLDSLSRELPRMRVLRNERRMGHGGAVRRGYELASKEYVFQVDSDRQFLAQEFHALYARIPGCDMVLGVRVARDDTLARKALSRFIALADAAIFGVWLRDANCPFRLMRRAMLRNLLAYIPLDAGAPNIMLSLLAVKFKARVCFVPVTHFGRHTGKVWLVRWRLVVFCLEGFWSLLMLRARILGKTRLP